MGGAQTHTRRTNHHTQGADRNTSVNAAMENDLASLLVAVLSPSEPRRAALVKVVENAGHRVVAVEQADVILSDAQTVSISTPAIVMGDENAESDNWLPSDADSRQIDAALRAVAAGLSIRVTRSSHRRGFEELMDASTQGVLTPRELDVINAIGAGLSNKAIARALGISMHTVKFHIESLLRKLGARTRAEAVAKALERRRRETIEL